MRSLAAMDTCTGWMLRGLLLLLVMLSATLRVNCEPRQAQSPPRMIEHPSSIVVPRGEPATLNCKAQGNPEPTIEWFKDKDGVRDAVETAREDPKSHRMLLPSGSLFFLRVIHGKNNKQDGGTYWCVAKNSLGTVVSRNATLEIAVLRDDFRDSPRDVKVAAGETAVLECEAPRGYPSPEVWWKKDGREIRGAAGRVKISDNGNLLLNDVRQADAGDYICVAENVVGRRESAPATLSVHVKPHFVRAPEDITAIAGESVEFACIVGGDPKPTIIWQREESKMPVERLSRNMYGGDPSLQCSRDDFRESPRDVKVAAGETASDGVAKAARIRRAPSGGGKKDGARYARRRTRSRCYSRQRNLLLKASLGAHETVGTQPAVINDEEVSGCRGSLGICAASALPHASGYQGIPTSPRPLPEAVLLVRWCGTFLHVFSLRTARPSFLVQPKDQRVGLGRMAIFECVTTGNPPPAVFWSKEGSQVLMFPGQKHGRFTVTAEGELGIATVMEEDEGYYVCSALSVAGSSIAKAYLEVTAISDNPPPIIRQGPDNQTLALNSVAMLPCQASGTPAPSIRWYRNTVPLLKNDPRITLLNSGTLQISGYFSLDLQEGWVTVDDKIPTNSFVIRGLRPGTRYVFLARTMNNHGLSLPSPISETITTKGGPRPTVAPYNPEVVRQKLSKNHVKLKQVEALSSTAIKLSWEVTGNKEYLQGFYIRYRRGSGDYETENLLDPDATFYTLEGLGQYVQYDCQVLPFYDAVEGRVSNTVTQRTLEDVPSAPPGNIRPVVTSLTSMTVYWDPPPADSRNGIIRSYKVYCLGSDTKSDENRTVDGGDTYLALSNLTTGMEYRVQIVAETIKGVGVLSEIVPITIDEAALAANDPTLGDKFSELVKEPWFIGVIGGILVVLLAILTIWLVRRRCRRSKKLLKTHYNAVPVKTDETHRANLNAREALWAEHNHVALLAELQKENNLLSKFDMPQHNDLNSASDYAEVNNIHTPNLKTFYRQPPGLTQPYASTNVLIGKPTNNMERPPIPQLPESQRGFVPIAASPHQARSDRMCSGSDDSCVKPEGVSSDTNTDNSRPNTGSSQLRYMHAADDCVDDMVHDPHVYSEHERMMSPHYSAGGGAGAYDDGGALACRMRPASRSSARRRSPARRARRADFADMLPRPPEHPPPRRTSTLPRHPAPHAQPDARGGRGGVAGSQGSSEYSEYAGRKQGCAVDATRHARQSDCDRRDAC
ncbi:PREDICTED: roundabout homolog 2-like [Priapulus caudatus]|uniref:Roundabout homolog 2-like n=1 Tax=Priapulus caudatus TaxID=37621 RepID=A0ABM1FB70_PRICU|nr:PREDICTED: roundabout homolog 2-like [Priapulus caudatus]